MNTTTPHPNVRYKGLPFRRQLRWRLISYFVILAVMPVTIVTAVTVRQGNDQNTQQIFNQLRSVTALKRDQIRSWLQQANLVLGTIREELDNSTTLQPLLSQIMARPDPRMVDSFFQ